MQIERTDKEIVIRVPAETDLPGLQRILDYIKFRNIASKSSATETQINDLAKESKSTWWEENKLKRGLENLGQKWVVDTDQLLLKRS